MRTSATVAMLAALALLTGCNRQPENVALFRLQDHVLPYPTDFHFYGSTDGTLNIQPTAGRELRPIEVEMNTLDGFSTIAAIRERFSSPLEPSSLTADAIRMVEVSIDETTRVITSVRRELALGTNPESADFAARTAVDSDGSVLELVPLKPLAPSTLRENVGYLIVLTRAIRTSAGAPVEPDVDYRQLSSSRSSCASFEHPRWRTACEQIASQRQLALSLGIEAEDIALTFSFSTQSTGEVLSELAMSGTTPPQSAIAQSTGLTTRQIDSTLPGHATLYRGTLRVPYYGSLPDASSPTAPLTVAWRGAPSPIDANSRSLTRFNPVPVATTMKSVPLLMSVPNGRSRGAGAKPVTGWPVVIFQHGLTRNRMDAVALADTFADADANLSSAGAQGYAIAAVDLPLHGIAGADARTSNPFYDALSERTFGLDLINNDTLDSGADGVIDDSGTHFINLSSVLTTRDNMRQAVSDLLTLARSLPNLDLDGDNVGDFDPNRIHFVGHSLGGIVGGVYLGVAPSFEVRTGQLASAGGGLAATLFDSPVLGPRMKQFLAGQGIEEGSTRFAEYVRDAQAVLDSSDPLNFVSTARQKRPLLIMQMVGGRALADGAISPPDQVVTNAATQRLIAAARLQRISTPGDNAVTAGFVNFVLGDHSSLISPRAHPATTNELRSVSVSFATSQGARVRIEDSALVQP